jgi:hypothetical protein
MTSNRYSRLIAAAITVTISLAAASQAAHAQPIEVQGRQDTDVRLRWAPPALSHPMVIELGDGPTDTKLRDDQDYVIKLPQTKKVGATIIEGGRNVVIIGGHITLPPASADSDQALSRAIFIKNNVGVVHIEGVLIDASGLGMSDGIDIDAPRSVVQIENVRVDGVFGFHDQFHAHVIKPFGGVAGLRIDKLTGYSGYQGLTLDTELGAIGSADISRVNLVAIRKQVWGPGNNGGQMIWLTKDAACGSAYPVRFGQVYVQPRAGTPLGHAVWPMAAGGGDCPARDLGNDAEVAFPRLPIVGAVERGLPPKGDFVPEGVAGVGYVSPGYQPAKPDPDDWIGIRAVAVALAAAQPHANPACLASAAGCVQARLDRSGF